MTWRHTTTVLCTPSNYFKKFLLFLLCFSLTSFSTQKKKKFIPPGTVQITEFFFADEVEITNMNWLEYEYWTSIKYGSRSPELIFTLPDTLVFRHKLVWSEPYVQYYYRHPAYHDYPVVGISYEQAIAFCKWRTERVKEFWAIKHKQELNIEYRLPTKEEWEMLSNNGSFNLHNNGKNAKGEYKLNCKPMPQDTLKFFKASRDDGDLLVPVKTYDKNWFGLFNIFGNVSEMIAEKGISKGGNYKSTIEQCRAGKDIPYTQPESWLGFRCVCVIKNNSI